MRLTPWRILFQLFTFSNFTFSPLYRTIFVAKSKRLQLHFQWKHLIGQYGRSCRIQIDFGSHERHGNDSRRTRPNLQGMRISHIYDQTNVFVISQVVIFLSKESRESFVHNFCILTVWQSLWENQLRLYDWYQLVY